MSSMAVSAPCHFFRKAEAVVFTVITFKVCFCCNVENFITGHHFFVTVAFHADLGMKFSILVAFCITKRLDIMQIVTVMAGCRIEAAGGNGLAVNRLAVH